MNISFLELQNIRCFKGKHRLDLSSKINLLVGPNNSGKSTILRAINSLQSNTLTDQDRTFDAASSAVIKIGRRTPREDFLINNQRFNTSTFREVYLMITGFSSYEWYGDLLYNPTSFPTGDQTLGSFNQYSASEPQNLIYPYFSNRKVEKFSNVATQAEASRVTGTLNNLYAKVDRLSNPARSTYPIFQQACEEILGFRVSSEYANEGRLTAFTVDDNRHIPLTAMGTGVANILGMIVDLCSAQNKIFLIEEPENDIHPKALKGLLRLIEDKSETNQFFISTHSNVAVRFLGANPDTKVFQIIPENDFSGPIKIPNSRVQEVPPNTVDRLKLLEDLGYDMFDFGLWKGWLFLEESSAEAIIKEFLIPQFAPGLTNKLRTYSARSISGVESKFEDFNNLFVYVHLDPSYKNRAWVVIDDGENEKEIIETLREKYVEKGWNANHFRQFSKHDFEDYYPQRFAKQIDAINAIDIKTGTRKEKDEKINEKRKAKEALINEVKAWFNANPDEARPEFEESAKEVIALLKEIEAALA